MKLWLPRSVPSGLVLLDDGIRLPRELSLWRVPIGLVRSQGHKLELLSAKDGTVWTLPKSDMYSAQRS